MKVVLWGLLGGRSREDRLSTEQATCCAYPYLSKLFIRAAGTFSGGYLF